MTGARRKTGKLTNEATVEEGQDNDTQAWKRGLKEVAIYRDG